MDQTFLEIKMTPDAVNAVLDCLGRQPTSTGLWPLLCDIREQANAQLKQREPQKTYSGPEL